MHKYRRTIMWLGLVLIIVLTVLSIYGAFIGAERAQQLFNQPPLVVYWTTLAILLIVGIAAFRRLLRVPGLLLIHAGCVLILAGGMRGSHAGHNLQKSASSRRICDKNLRKSKWHFRKKPTPGSARPAACG